MGAIDNGKLVHRPYWAILSHYQSQNGSKRKTKSIMKHFRDTAIPFHPMNLQYLLFHPSNSTVKYPNN